MGRGTLRMTLSKSARPASLPVLAVLAATRATIRLITDSFYAPIVALPVSLQGPASPRVLGETKSNSSGSTGGRGFIDVANRIPQAFGEIDLDQRTHGRGAHRRYRRRQQSEKLPGLVSPGNTRVRRSSRAIPGSWAPNRSRCCSSGFTI